MYKNLRAEVARAGMTRDDCAETIDKSKATWDRLVAGKQPFKLGEMMALQSELEERNDAEYTLDYLFKEVSEDGEGDTDSRAHGGTVRPD